MSKSKTVVTQAALDEHILSFVINEGMPSTIVRSESFKELVLLGLPGKKVMCYQTLQKKLAEEFETMKNRLRERMIQPAYICITADCWTAGRRGFIGVTAHWLEEDLSRSSVVLACKRIKGRHTYDVLARYLEEILQDYGIQNKTVGAVTDSGSNFVKAFSLFQDLDILSPSSDASRSEEDRDEDEDQEIQYHDVEELLDSPGEAIFRLPPHHKCAAHKLNLVASVDSLAAASEDNHFKKISRAALAKASQLWNKQSRSSLASDLIHDQIGCLFTVPCDTRWNSMFMSMQKLALVLREKEDRVQSVMDRLGLPRFNDRDKLFIREYVQVMQHCAKALNVLQGEKSSYLGCLLPVISGVRKKLEDEKENLTVCSSLCDALLAGVQKRFESERNDKRALIAAVIHPRFKVSWLDTEEEKLRAWEALRSELGHESSDSLQAEGLSEEDDEMDFFCPKQGSDSSDVLEEYKSTGVTRIDQLSNFPALKNLFVKYNTTLPSSASVERLFSHGGGLFRKNRYSLKDENFERQLLLKLNK